MANILTVKLINNAVKLDDVLCWMTEINCETTKYPNITELCSQKDFVTYFLNSLHDISINEATSETPTGQKVQNSSTDASRKRLSLSNGSNSIPEETRKSTSSNDFSQNTLDLTCTTSTPKHGRSIFNGSLTKEYSPISNSTTNNTSANGSLCLGDFIVTKKKNSTKKKSNKKGNTSVNEIEKKTFKKLKPTNLNESRFNSMELKSGNSFSFQNKFEEVSRESTKRDFMTREISVLKTKLSESHISALPSRVCELKAEKSMNIDPKCVRYKNEIEKIVTIYEYLLKHGFVLSLVGELYFIITLLLSKSSCDIIEECDEGNNSYGTVTFNEIFKSIHNVIFFASSILDKIFYILKSLDTTTMKFLCDNERLKLFSPKLVERLLMILEDKAECMLNLYNSNGKRNICFILETDNRSNFPSDASFHGFKKQRDMFYEILRQWEDNHSQPSWDFEFALGRKVRSLVGYHNDPVNFMRFSRLFMEQLLNACSKMSKSTEMLTSISSNLDKDKFDRLKNRLVKKQSNSLNSAPDFQGYQEFFRDFIAISNNITFQRHLCNTLISEIIDLNGTTFENLDSEDNETELDTKKSFVLCLKSLKTLAKFLGFIESIPYKNDNVHNEELINFQIQIRCQVNPNLNVLKLFKDSLSSGNLTLFVPWLCEYLSMLDTVTLRTSYYIEVIENMIYLYRCFVQSESLLPHYNALLIEFSLGWFFELNNFPHNVFFDKLDNNCDLLKSKLVRTSGIDRLNIIDYNLLYIFCPFLEEIRKLLANETAVKDRITSRHITPLTKVESPKASVNKRIEFQLEEAFFNGHPSSLKKTVDFVAERIASTCVKHLCYSVVPDFKKQFIVKLQTYLKQSTTAGEMQEVELKNKCAKLAEENLTILKTLCDEEVNKIVQSRVKDSIIVLLPMDYMPQMQSICVSAAERMCREKVNQWSSTHIVIGVLTKEVKIEVKNFIEQKGNRSKPSYILPPCGSSTEHNPNTESGPHTLNRLRELAASVLSKPEEISEESLTKLSEDLYKTVTQRNDLNEMVISMINSQLLDLVIILSAYQPSTAVKVTKHFFKIWRLQGKKAEGLFENIISLRNLALISRSGSTLESSKSLAEFCVALIKEELLSCNSFEAQCTGLFKYDLDNVSLRTVTTFLKQFVELYETQCKSSRFTLMLEFLSEFCSDL